MKKNKYLLDANCFYTIKSNEKKKQKLYSFRENILIAPLAILEIANVKEKEDYQKRKDAMRALNYINAHIIKETQDEIVAKAFGQKAKKPLHLKKADWKKDFINPVIYSDSIEDIDKEINLELLRQQKQEYSDWFTDEVVKGNKTERENRIEDLKKELNNENEKELKRIAESIGINESLNITGYIATIVGLSVRAGLHSDEEFEKSIVDDRFLNEKLIINAFNNYDKSLDSYIKFYQAFQSRMAKLGQIPERNAIWDIDYTMYLDAFETPLIFVTTEPRLIEIGAESIPGRVISFKEFEKLI